MGKKHENNGFICEYCGQTVLPVTNGRYRNHCPFCLYSKHVDNDPGDRQCSCHGLMRPVGLTYGSGKGLQIIHVCLNCRIRKVNVVAEFTIQPDEMDALVKCL